MCRTCFPDIHGHRTMIPICGRMFVCVVFLQLVPMGSGNLKNRVHWRDRHFVDLFLCVPGKQSGSSPIVSSASGGRDSCFPANQTSWKPRRPGGGKEGGGQI